VLIDVAQNAEGRPLAAAYSARAFPRAPVSTPVLAKELKANLKPENFNIRTMAARLKEKGDLWGEFWKTRQTLEKAIELLSKQMAKVEDLDKRQKQIPRFARNNNCEASPRKGR
jgi:bifunctional non-homologous end joining protein LigD